GIRKIPLITYSRYRFVQKTVLAWDNFRFPSGPLQEHSGLIPGVDGQDLIGRTGGYAVGNWMVFSLMPTPFD
ncbi:hypothetical protein, partial [Escherichia coli]|uniref:hypothetical protein n=1 Tax=Escherichia coli TaxID=562 RepID=UPI00292C0F6C